MYKDNIQQEAANLYLALFCGVEILDTSAKWCDNVLVKENIDYENIAHREIMDSLIEMSINKSYETHLSMLKQIALGANHLKAMRTTLGRVYYLITQKNYSLSQFNLSEAFESFDENLEEFYFIYNLRSQIDSIYTLHESTLSAEEYKHFKLTDDLIDYYAGYHYKDKLKPYQTSTSSSDTWYI